VGLQIPLFSVFDGNALRIFKEAAPADDMFFFGSRLFAQEVFRSRKVINGVRLNN
jgi:hypothetical protein